MRGAHGPEIRGLAPQVRPPVHRQISRCRHFRRPEREVNTMQNVLDLVELVIADDTERGLFGVEAHSCGQTSSISDHC
jgi:hypothetical protein